MSKDTTKRKKASGLYVLVTIVMLLSTIIGAMTIVKVSSKIALTGYELATLHDNIDYYNNNKRKTDESEDAVDELLTLRREKFYHSEDKVVRTFSNLFSPIKFLVWILSIAVTLVVPICIILKGIATLYNRYRRKKARMARIARNEAMRKTRRKTKYLAS